MGLKFSKLTIAAILVVASASDIAGIARVAAEAEASSVGLKQLLVTMDSRFDAAHLESKLRQRLRQRRLSNGDVQALGKHALRGGDNMVEEDAIDAEDSMTINVKGETHLRKLGRKTVHIEVSEDTVNLISEVDGVVTVEEDGPVWLAQVADVGTQSTVLPSSRLWGLDRLDQTTGLDSSYSWDNAAADVDVYIVDSGVFAGHDDFYGRVDQGADMFNAPTNGYGNSDCNSHGTHVASIATGKVYGVAKKAKIIPVRAVGCDGRGTVSALVNSLNWAVNSAENRKRKSVVNISLSAGFSNALNNAVKDAVLSGLVVVVAAGNNGGDACFYSPASEPSALTVGGTSIDDSKLSISNFGSCVDIFAPGDAIVAASNTNPAGTLIKRGTSMASPQAAGAAAVVWSKNPTKTNTWVIDEVKRLGVKSRTIVDEDCQGGISPDLLLHLPVSPQQSSTAKITSYLAKGDRLGSDFLDWPADFSSSANGNICFMFDAKITYGASSGGSILVGFASESSPSGLRAYQYAATTCKVADFSFYEINIQAGTNTLINKVGERLATSETVANKNLIKSNSLTSMYARVVRSGAVATIEVGMGKVLGENLLLSARDTQASKKPAMTRMSLSTSYLYDITYSNIRPCDSQNAESPTEPSVTLSPTPAQTTKSPSPSGTITFGPTLGIKDGDTFSAIKKTTMGNFSKFWKYGGSGDFCFEFTARGKSNILIALSESSSGFQFKVASNSYVVALHRPRTKLPFAIWRGTQLGSASAKKLPKGFNAKISRRFRVEMVDNTIQVRDFTNDSDTSGRVLVQWTDSDDASRLNPKYLSLSGVKTSNIIYENIREC